MNAISLLAAQPGVERLGATLLHFAWEGLLIAIVYAAARHAVRRSSPQVRYGLACAALAAMSAAPALTWILLSLPASATDISTAAASLAPAAAAAHAPILAAFFLAAESAAPQSLLPWVVAVWLAGATFFWLRLVGSWMLAERLRSAHVRPAPGEWQQAFDRLRGRIRLRRPVRLLVSGLAQTPAVVGALRPIVLMPVGALAGLPPEQVEALLLHELAHIRRNDYLVNAAQSIVEALLFYHPAVWWVSAHIRAERELCCDDIAVSATGDAVAYARALAELATVPFLRGTALAAAGGHLAHRVSRLLGDPRPSARPVARPGLVAAAILPALAAIALFAQSDVRPNFAAASVKPIRSESLRSVRFLPGRLVADAPVRLLIQRAYGVQGFQVAGGPEWIDSERFEVEGKSAGNATRAQLLLMLQSLLEDRFQLQFHRETRELPVYALVASKSGLKLPPPKPDGCEEPASDAAPGWAGGRMAVPTSGAPLRRPLCGIVGVALQLQGAVMQGGKVGMADLTHELSLVLDRTVIDRTGFTGQFDLRIVFEPDGATPSMPPPPPGTPADSGAPSLPQALGQVGLRLESTKGPVEVLVIDRITKNR